MLMPSYRVCGYFLALIFLGLVLINMQKRIVSMGQWSVKQMFTSAPRFDQSQLLTTEQYSTSVNTDGQWNVNHLITSTQSQPLTTTSYDRHSMTGDSQGPVPVIILTYMRSGSSFAGQVLQAAPSTFYWFEPLHSVLFRYHANRSCQFTFLDGSKRSFASFEDLASLTINSILSCNLDNLPVAALSDGFVGQGNKDTSKTYLDCVKSYRKIMGSQVLSIRKCLPGYIETCRRSKHVVIKTIRMTMASVERLLERLSRLKIIHLMRDPRGTVRSQMRFGKYNRSYMKDNVTAFCRQVLKDVIYREKLETKYPSRLVSVFYEDLATSPVKYAKMLYRFLGMNFNEEAENKIVEMTSSGGKNEKCGPLCTYRANSSEEAYEWRLQVKMTFVTLVDESCGDLYSQLGYKNISNETDLHDPNFQLRETRN